MASRTFFSATALLFCLSQAVKQAVYDGPCRSLRIALVGNQFRQQFPLLGYGGIEGHVEAIAAGLHGLGCDFSVITPRVTQEPRGYPFEVIQTPSFTAPGSADTYCEEVAGVINSMKRKPDVIWSFSHWSAVNLHGLGIPMITTHEDSGTGLVLHPYKNVQHRFVSRNQYSVWLANHQENAWFNSPPEGPKPAIVWEGFPAEEFVPPQAEREGYVLAVGRKGIDGFLQLAQQNPDVKFVLYEGSNWKPDSMPSNVEYRGVLRRGEEHHRAFAQAGSLYMKVDWEEAFGRTIIEAMSKGTPVLGSTRGSLPELIPEFAGVRSENLDDFNGALRRKYEYGRIFQYAKSKFQSEDEVAHLASLSQDLVDGLRGRESA